VICERKLERCGSLLRQHPSWESPAEQDPPAAQTRYRKGSPAVHRNQQIKEREDLLNCSELLPVIV